MILSHPGGTSLERTVLKRARHRSGLFQTKLLSSLVGIYCLSCKLMNPPPPASSAFSALRASFPIRTSPRWEGSGSRAPRHVLPFRRDISDPNLCVSWCPSPGPRHKRGFLSASRFPRLTCALLVSVARSHCAVARGQEELVAA